MLVAGVVDAAAADGNVVDNGAVADTAADVAAVDFAVVDIAAVGDGGHGVHLCCTCRCKKHMAVALGGIFAVVAVDLLAIDHRLALLLK